MAYLTFLSYSTYGTGFSSLPDEAVGSSETFSTLTLSTQGPAISYDPWTTTSQQVVGLDSSFTQSITASYFSVTAGGNLSVSRSLAFRTSSQSLSSVTTNLSRSLAGSIWQRTDWFQTEIISFFSFSSVIHWNGVFTYTASGSGQSLTFTSLRTQYAFVTSTSVSSTVLDSISTSLQGSASTDGTTTGTAWPSDATVTVSSTGTTTESIVSTQAQTVTHTRWTAAAGAAARTTFTVTTIAASLATITNNFNTTVTGTLLNGTWTFFNVIGTVFLASANTDGPELPYFFDPAAVSAGELAGAWNAATATQTTVWNLGASTTTGAVTTTATSAISHVASIAIPWSTVATIFGLSTYTTTTSLFSPVAFTSRAGGSGELAPNPLATVTASITTWASFTLTLSTTFTTPYNTTNTTGGQTTTFSAALGIPASNGSRTTSYTLLTAVDGLTTASAAIANGQGQSQWLTTLISGPGLSQTTTTLSQSWSYDSTCPTVLLATPIVTSHTSSSSASGTFVSNSATFTSSNVTSGTSSGGSSNNTFGFIQRLFAQPSQIPWTVSTVRDSTATAAFVASPNAVSWNAAPSMQAFAPINTQSKSFQSLFLPSEMQGMTFGAGTSGELLSFRSDSSRSGYPITSTAWGVWEMWGEPAITTFSSTSSTGTSTTTFTGSTVTAFTESQSYTASNITAIAAIVLPTNLQESAATFSITSTQTTTTTGATTTTTVSGTTSYTGASFASSITSTFAESFTHATDAVPLIPGIGGLPRYTAGAATVWAWNAALSFFDGTGSHTSLAVPNLFGVVIGDNFTTTSSEVRTSSLLPFTVYTLPGAASWLSSPLEWLSTSNSSSMPAIASGTDFWATVDTRNIPLPPGAQS